MGRAELEWKESPEPDVLGPRFVRRIEYIKIPSLWYLSFCDGRLPAGAQFLGCCFVEAGDFLDAVSKTHALGINPGGEVMAFDLAETAEKRWPEAGMQNRLLGMDELRTLWPEVKSQREWDEEDEDEGEGGDDGGEAT